MLQKLISGLIAGSRNGLTTVFGAIPGAVVAVGEILDLIDGDATTIFEFRTFAMSAGMAVAFLVARDANKTSEKSGAK